MKSFILLLFFIPASMSAQLYVSNSNYLYVKNEIVFVQQEVNLDTGANFYLRDEGQLIQGTTSASANIGQGELSVFQEGNTNNFAFNYWCSPVGNASASAGNENFGITMLQQPSTVTASTPALTTMDVNGTANPLTVSAYWIYKYLSSITNSGWTYVGSAKQFAAGEGFTMKGTSGTDATIPDGSSIQNNSGSAQRYDFRGKPNDGNITVGVAASSFTLTGNPYPSALHLNAFLLDPSNTACTAVAYFWEQDKTVNNHILTNYKGGYGTYSPVSLGSAGIYVPPTFDTYNPNGTVNTVGTTSGTAMARKYSPIGQGFMVEGATNGTLTLKNSHRAYYKESTLPNSYFNRNAIPGEMAENDSVPTQISHIRLNTSIDNLFTRQMVLAFVPDATDGVDRGIDAKGPGDDELPNDIYFLLDAQKYVIQGVAFDVNKRLPLGIKAAGSVNFSIGLAEAVDFDTEQAIYIYDALDNSYHDIRTGDYTLQLSEGTYNTRFEITFTTTTLAIPGEQLSDLIIVQDNVSEVLKVSNPNGKNIKIVACYDILGRQIFQKNGNGTAFFEYPTSGLSTAIYLIKVTDDTNAVKTQKVIVK